MSRIETAVSAAVEAFDATVESRTIRTNAGERDGFVFSFRVLAVNGIDNVQDLFTALGFGLGWCEMGGAPNGFVDLRQHVYWAD